MNRRIIISCLALLATACILLILVLAAWLVVFKLAEPSSAAFSGFKESYLLVTTQIETLLLS
jgi:hypothetical protein